MEPEIYFPEPERPYDLEPWPAPDEEKMVAFFKGALGMTEAEARAAAAPIDPPQVVRVRADDVPHNNPGGWSSLGVLPAAPAKAR